MTARRDMLWLGHPNGNPHFRSRLAADAERTGHGPRPLRSDVGARDDDAARPSSWATTRAGRVETRRRSWWRRPAHGRTRPSRPGGRAPLAGTTRERLPPGGALDHPPWRSAGSARRPAAATLPPHGNHCREARRPTRRSISANAGSSAVRCAAAARPAPRAAGATIGATHTPRGRARGGSAAPASG